MNLWQCPYCGREFARRGQSHSCVSVSVEDHFRGKPERLRGVFRRMLEALEEGGTARVDAVKSAINLADRFHFAMVYVQRDGLKVEFGLGRELEGPRILRTQRLAPNLVLHFVKVSQEEEVDDQLLGWLKEAQAAEAGPLSSRRGSRNG
ncbi:MAG: DUF5655 domain-containing protein [Thermoplasmata archaeon]